MSRESKESHAELRMRSQKKPLRCAPHFCLPVAPANEHSGPFRPSQGSSVVEQRTHKPLAAGSIPAPGTIFNQRVR